MKKNFVLFSSSLLVGFIILEFLCRTVLGVGYSYPDSSLWYKERWLENHERQSPKGLAYSIDKYDSLLGWVLKENFRDYNMGNNWRVSSNSAGCRGKQEYAFSRNSKLRIITIGDSFTFGECVNDSETYPAVLETLLDSTEVINLAVHGYGHDQQLLRLKTLGAKYKPDIVVLGFIGVDAIRNRLWFRDYAKPWFKLQNDTLVLQGVPVIKPEDLLSEARLHSLGILQAAYGSFTAETNIGTDDKLTMKILDEFVKTCRKMDAAPLVLYLPGQDECISGKRFPYSLADTMCTYPDVKCVYPIKAIHDFLQNKDDKKKFFDCHYSPEIHYELANCLLEEINKIPRHSYTR